MNPQLSNPSVPRPDKPAGPPTSVANDLASSPGSSPAAPRLRCADRHVLLPAMPLEDLLTPDHHARTVWRFVQGLDLTPLLKTILSVEGRPGRPATDPQILMALWLFATIEGIGSARALDWLCSNHHGFRWLCGGVSVNYQTLSDFRVQHVALLDDVLTHSVAVLLEQDLVDLNRAAQDGMRVRASAGAASFRRRPTLEQCLHEAHEQVQRLRRSWKATPRKPTAGSTRPSSGPRVNGRNGSARPWGGCRNWRPKRKPTPKTRPGPRPPTPRLPS